MCRDTYKAQNHLAFLDPVAKLLPDLTIDGGLPVLTVLIPVLVLYYVPYHVLTWQQYPSWKTVYVGWVIAVIPTIVEHGGYKTYLSQMVYFCVAVALVISEICHWRFGWYEDRYRNRLAEGEILDARWKITKQELLDQIERYGHSVEETRLSFTIVTTASPLLGSVYPDPKYEKPASNFATPPLPTLFNYSAENEKADPNSTSRLQPPPAPACSESRTGSSISPSRMV
ncbi:hypothetical protein H2199_005477 [Coniosporium tulheliwenetii]|uniref:Uncharacterized protein n=1 Tax=Coniosporium tulheliwenetii TaxID=3383036 RepID=A0ACC2Z2N1_9PEZI|nr:hypothetical protein H2199_005477 [Cladosporium sp. JES 115]